MISDLCFVTNALMLFEQSTGIRASIQNPNESSITRDSVLSIYFLGLDGQPSFFDVEVAQLFSLSVFRELLNRQSELLSLVTVTNYVDPAMAKQCKKNNIQFVDSAGNAYIKGDDFFLFSVGNSPPETTWPEVMRPLFKPSCLRVLLYLLQEKKMTVATTREIAETSGGSLGTISAVTKHLRDMGFLEDRGRQGRKVVEKEKLFNIWATGFNEIIRPKCILGRYSSSSIDWEQRVTLPAGVCWGGELADQGKEDLFPEKIIIYADKIPDEIFQQYFVTPDPRGNIEVFNAILGPNLNAVKTGVVHPIFVFADLLYCGSEAKAQAKLELILNG